MFLFWKTTLSTKNAHFQNAKELCLSIPWIHSNLIHFCGISTKKEGFSCHFECLYGILHKTISSICGSFIKEKMLQDICFLASMCSQKMFWFFLGGGCDCSLFRMFASRDLLLIVSNLFWFCSDCRTSVVSVHILVMRSPLRFPNVFLRLFLYCPMQNGSFLRRGVGIFLYNNFWYILSPMITCNQYFFSFNGLSPCTKKTFFVFVLLFF